MWSVVSCAVGVGKAGRWPARVLLVSIFASLSFAMVGKRRSAWIACAIWGLSCGWLFLDLKQAVNALHTAAGSYPRGIAGAVGALALVWAAIVVSAILVAASADDSDKLGDVRTQRAVDQAHVG